ncbi:hypothetical protein [Microterricola viridarii]|uniref:DUF1524 domain-containing protein n=1 Tax=Microterricola viridarii TaxID=412690 RepID=A0A0X8E4G4_9MICO|nr:hypothetical protein [Microterricola viridarii]AMB59233.1 hypothetical protein AWU67_10575 [Microterricola viridarii]
MLNRSRIALVVALCGALTVTPAIGAFATTGPEGAPTPSASATPQDTVPTTPAAAPVPVPTTATDAPEPTGPLGSEPSAPPAEDAAQVEGPDEVAAPLAARATGPTTTVRQLLDALKVATPSTTRYDRAQFEEGVIAPGAQCRTRVEVLRQESRVSVTTGSTPCTIRAGEWLSWYDGSTQTDPTLLEMDHLVALKEAWISGADRWTAEQRRD